MANGRVESLLRLSNRVAYSSWVSCALGVLVSIFSGIEIAALLRLDPTAPYSWDIDYIDPMLALIGGGTALLQIIAFVIAGFLSLRWIYRANSNAHCLSANLEMSPGWNVGWFFVPIAAWWKPYEGLRDVWRVSANPQNPKSVELPSMLASWWTFWLLTSITGSISFRLQMHATTVSAAIIADGLDILSGVTLVPATYLFLALVRDITANQQPFAVTKDGTEISSDFGSEPSR